MASPYVALVTATSMAKEDFDQAPLLDALAALGVEAHVLAWDDPAAQGGLRGAALCLLRSTWNYVRHHEAFLAWVDEIAVATALWNPAPIVRWNSHKGYLLELEDRGLPVVPTHLLARGSGPAIEDALDQALATWPVIVVKPAVGAGSFGTIRVAAADRGFAAAHLARFLPERDMLIQRYEAAVEHHGERSLIWIDGAFTHAVRKQARFAGDPESVSLAAVPIADDERALATCALAAVPASLLYARVDLIRDPAGIPRIMELELIEPSLFFARQPSSAPRLAAAIRARLGG